MAYKSDEEKAEAAALFAALKEAHEVLSHEPTRRECNAAAALTKAAIHSLRVPALQSR